MSSTPSIHKVFGNSDIMLTGSLVDMQAGFVSTWSAYNSYRQDKPQQPDLLVQFKQDFLEAAKLSSLDEEFRAIYPLFLMLCKTCK